MKTRDATPENEHEALGAFTLEAIRPVRDFTARKTLEQAHAFAAGLAELVREAEREPEARQLLDELEGVGVTVIDVERTAQDALSLLELMADRDRKADVFHAAVRAAGQAERAMNERINGVARLLRVTLGGGSSALSRFGVPVEGEGAAHRARPLRKGSDAPPAKAVGT